MKKEIDITFKNVADFRNRIASLWQRQKEDEVYCFFFKDEETEKEFETLLNCFHVKDADQE